MPNESLYIYIYIYSTVYLYIHDMICYTTFVYSRTCRLLIFDTFGLYDLIPLLRIKKVRFRRKCKSCIAKDFACTCGVYHFMFMKLGVISSRVILLLLLRNPISFGTLDVNANTSGILIVHCTGMASRIT